jgi:cytochrome c-type biogenesis protein
MLLLYSMGLGIPFIVTAVLIEKLKSAFDFIKKNYKVINIISGIFLILTGVLMATGLFSKLTILLS